MYRCPSCADEVETEYRETRDGKGGEHRCEICGARAEEIEMQKPKHSRLPWTVKTIRGRTGLFDAEGYPVLHVEYDGDFGGVWATLDADDAELIVRAVNATQEEAP